MEATPRTASLRNQAKIQSSLKTLPYVDSRLRDVQPVTSDEFKFLRSLYEFSEIPDIEIKSLATTSRFATFKAGQFISIEGSEETSYGFIVATGRVAISETSINGKELIVELLQSGDSLGLLLMLAARELPMQFSARCLQKSKILRVPIRDFERVLNPHPELYKKFAAHLLLSLQASYRLSRELAHDRVEVRIAEVLSTLTLKFAIPNLDNEACTIKFTRAQIANLTGTTPETAIRVTRDMQRNGIIEIKKPGVISILNLDALHELADQGDPWRNANVTMV